MAPFIEDVMAWLQLFIACGTVITLIYALGKFAAKPTTTQNDRLSRLEEWQSKVIIRLAEGDEHMAELDESNRVTQKALLAMLSHEISGNDIEKLKEARKELETYLIQK